MPALYVIRHAEPALTGVLLGQSDPPLSDAGRTQAEGLAALLPASTIYSSPLRRALETAYCLSESPIIVPQLAEISYGKWDGLTWTEIEKKWPDLAEKKLEEWEEVIPPGGEPWREFCERVQDGLRSVLTGDFPAVIIAHEAVNAAIVQALTGAAIQSYKQAYCEMKKYDINCRS